MELPEPVKTFPATEIDQLIEPPGAEEMLPENLAFCPADRLMAVASALKVFIERQDNTASGRQPPAIISALRLSHKNPESRSPLPSKGRV
jgi:hypothetical protein